MKSQQWIRSLTSLVGPGELRDRAAAWPEGREVIHMLLARQVFAISRTGELTRSRGHRRVERRIVPQRTHGLVPGRDLLFARERVVLSVIQSGIGSTRPPPPSLKSPPIDVRQRAAVADERRNRR